MLSGASRVRRSDHLTLIVVMNVPSHRGEGRNLEPANVADRPGVYIEVEEFGNLNSVPSILAYLEKQGIK